MKKKGKEGAADAGSSSKKPAWYSSMDLNNVVYFFMGLFGVWPGGM